MKKILIISGIAVLGLGLFSNPSIAKNSKTSQVKEQVKQLFSKEYNNEDLLYILADIEMNIQNNDMKEVRNKSEDLADYLHYRKSQIAMHKDKYSDSNVAYSGSKVLEIKYGNWVNSKELILPIVIRNNPIAVDLLKNEEALMNFKENEINSAKVRYVSFDVGHKKAGSDLRELLSSLDEGDSKQIRENVKNVYDDILIDHDSKISLVSKIRTNLAVARYLNDNNQPKAAQDSVGVTDSLMLRLIEVRTDSQAEQQRIKDLRKALNNISKVSDANYLSEWEKVPEEVGNWGKK
jgi:hypothetical protein